MGARAERLVVAGSPADVQPVRLGEDGRVPVGRFSEEDHPFTGPDGPVGDLDVLQCRPALRGDAHLT